MENRYYKISIFFLLLILLTFSLFSMTSLPIYASTTLSLNTKLPVIINKGEIIPFTFSIPDTNYYVVETRGELDTFLSVEGLSGGTRYDDNSGVSSNACIGFTGEIKTITIYLSCTYSSHYGNTNIQIRKQQAVLYGFDYGDINTKPDLDTPYSVLKDNYDTYKFTDNSIHNLHLNYYDSRSYQRLNSEIVFFSGHGIGTKSGSKGNGISFPSGDYNVSYIGDMENVKIAVWSACYSSNTSNPYNNSMSQRSVQAGSSSAIGWPEVILVSSARTFTNRLFNKLADGSNISDAAIYARNGIIWPWDAVRNYSLAGSTTTTIASTKIYKTGLGTNQYDINEFELRFNLYNDWYIHNNNDGSMRIYKTINGCLTNDYYDINIKGNKVVDVQHSGIMLNNQTILERKDFYRNIPSSLIKNNILFNNLVDVENHYVYYIVNDKAIPIEIKYCHYEKDEGLTFLEPVCTNLYDNSNIDYSLINGGC